MMSETSPKPFVFVLMPFGALFEDVYKLGIKPAAEGAGAYCERVDEQIFAESILARIYNQIAKADLIVADMTGRNPNVFYEVGYAHALGRTVILLTQASDDIPFDLKHYPHIIYASSIAKLKENLGKRVLYHLANPQIRADLAMPRVDILIAGTLIEEGICIDIPVDILGHRSREEFIIGVHNSDQVPIEDFEQKLGLVFPQEFPPPYSVYGIQLPDKRFFYEVGAIGRLLPGAWGMHSIQLPRAAIDKARLRKIPVELLLFTPTGPRATKFAIRFMTGLVTN